MTLNKKGWSYMKQTKEEVYDYLKSVGRLYDFTEKQARLAVEYYTNFCSKFENNRIPDTFGTHYISGIYKANNASSFYISFKGEIYLLTNGNLFKTIIDENVYRTSLKWNSINLAPDVEKLDWRFLKLSEKEIYKFFSKENFFKDLPRRKFTLEAKKRAATFYKKRCDMVLDKRIDEFLAIDNIRQIELDENGYNFKFYFKEGCSIFYYFGINPSSKKFEVW